MIPLKSKTTQKILNYYFLNPHARHYINELARLLELDPKNVDTKLKELEREGLLQSKFAGKQRYFSLRRGSPLLKIYKNLLLQTTGLEGQLREAIKRVPKVRKAVLFGSYAKNTMTVGSDIDLLVIGDHSLLALQKVISPIQKASGREINVVTMTEKEFREKKQKHNPFIQNVFSGKLIKLV